MNKMENNENQSVCSSCGGRCCKRFAGAIFPADLGTVTEEKLFEMVRGNYIFDDWSGDPRPDKNKLMNVFFLRPRHRGETGYYEGSWGGVCGLLAPNGCMLPFDERPTTCKAVVPSAEDYKCYAADEFSKRNCCIAWIPYQGMIKRVINKCLDIKFI